MTTNRHGRPWVKVTVVSLGVLLGACAGASAPLPTPTPVPGLGPARSTGPVRPGIEGILGDSAHLIRGRAVGLVSNHAAVDGAGVSDVDRLLRAGIRLVALFGPEHGYRGTADEGETVASTVDSATRLPIYSLYDLKSAPIDSTMSGTSAPSDTMMAGVEVLLVDLPDVGARYYTYLATTIEVMRAAKRLGRTVILLDRPNPIGGAVQGNMLEAAHRSTVGALAMPMRHGLTLGELARLANLDLAIGADLRVVPVANWTRTVTLADTGLPYFAPSPNLKDLESLFHYPGTCMFEGTALSVGRGTDLPFHQIGAPWLDVPAVLEALPTTRLPGVQFLGVRFTPVKPSDLKWAGVTVPGIRLVLTDPETYDPTLTAAVLLSTIRRIHPDRIGFRPASFDKLAGGPSFREALLADIDPFALLRGWAEARNPWLAHREAILIYR